MFTYESTQFNGFGFFIVRICAFFSLEMGNESFSFYKS